MAYEIMGSANPMKGKFIPCRQSETRVIARTSVTFFGFINKASISVHEIVLDKKKPVEIIIIPTLDFNDKVIILVDDVAKYRAHLLYALKPLLQFHPKRSKP